MDKDVVHIYSGIILSHKKNKINALCSNMDRPQIVILSEVSQRKYFFFSFFFWPHHAEVYGILFPLPDIEPCPVKQCKLLKKTEV